MIVKQVVVALVGEIVLTLLLLIVVLAAVGFKLLYDLIE